MRGRAAMSGLTGAFLFVFFFFNNIRRRTGASGSGGSRGICCRSFAARRLSASKSAACGTN